ncbi:serine threonine- kinase Nek5-like [Paramuricea clavata]|uniref:non-specific serine/threonine protein kinase n=1 Tax=Paramuricea clavata TaxID=317549 RepID=A0A7D9I673_PARCT|nr:serine threonine- kinase Nek5-like [Paramuricea clavata]
MLPKEQIIDWFIQLCLALKYIHGMNILHRDIKCQNIFISKENVIKLGDFGIACVLQNTLDHAQTVIGTPYYLSPEICHRQPYNHKSDIWAMGCVLYEMITLRHPFESTDFAQLVLKILHGDFTPIPENHGTLLQDLVTVLLRDDPCERPSAKQILHIPAMQAYVNKVLARGRTQRSESVSCSEGQSVRKGNVWRKPDVIPSSENMSQEKSKSECDVHAEEKSKTFSVDVCCASTNEVVNVETRKSPRKRISSEVFPAQDYRSFDELKRMKIGRGKDFVRVVESDKENHNPTQHGPSKHRSYSTSIVRESAERNPLGVNPMRVKRSPLAPLNKLQVSLHATYDVIPDPKQVLQGTYTKQYSCRASIDDETASHSSQTTETVAHKDTTSDRRGNNNRLLAKNSSDLKTDNSTSQTEFLKILLGSSHMVFRNTSPESSLKEYVQAMRSTLEESLGLEMFTALHKYLCFDVKKDLGSGLNICETFFQALGQDGIVFVPLMLQYIQCEKNLAT